MTNIHPGTVDEMYKIASINLSPGTVGQVRAAAAAAASGASPPGCRTHTPHPAAGPRTPLAAINSRVPRRPPPAPQVAMSCMVNPPKAGEPSYELWSKERDGELASLRRRAHMVTDGFNSLEGVTCNFTEGAMYRCDGRRGGGRAGRGALLPVFQAVLLFGSRSRAARAVPRVRRRSCAVSSMRGRSGPWVWRVGPVGPAALQPSQSKADRASSGLNPRAPAPHPTAQLPAPAPARQGGRGGQGRRQGARRFLLPAPARGHRHLHRPRQRLWPGGGHLPPADHHPAAGGEDGRVCRALPVGGAGSVPLAAPQQQRSCLAACRGLELPTVRRGRPGLQAARAG
jgi:hypothetical protein